MNAFDCFVRGFGMSLAAFPMATPQGYPGMDAVAIHRDFRAVGQDMYSVIAREAPSLLTAPVGHPQFPQQLDLFGPRV
jgi:hypothetical protein